MKKHMRTFLLTGAVICLTTAAHAEGYGSQSTYGTQSNVQGGASAGVGSGSMSGTASGYNNTSSRYDSMSQGATLDYNQIRNLQQTLLSQGYSPGPVDGILGSRTADAIREFQQDNGLTASGTVDAQTATRLGLNIGARQNGWMNDTGTDMNSDMNSDTNSGINSDMDSNSNIPGRGTYNGAPQSGGMSNGSSGMGTGGSMQ